MRFGVSVKLVTMVRRNDGAPFTKAKLTCSDCCRPTRSKSATDGRSAARIEEEVVVGPAGVEVLTKFPAQDLYVTNPY